jgi:glutaredoxin
MNAEPLKVYWQPGCSSCVKVKEFLTEHGVEFESVNILDSETAMDELAKLGARSIPVVSRGDKFTFAQSLEDVAKFVNVEKTGDRLPPDELVSRWKYFLTTARGLIEQIPADKLSQNAVADRDRSMLELSYHIFQVPEAFLETVENHLEDWTLIANVPPPEDVKTTEDVLEYADAITARLERWWANLDDKACQWPVKMFYGEHPVHDFLERSTWHSAQHTRQIDAVLTSLGVNSHSQIKDGAYDGLPMPKGLWR